MMKKCICVFCIVIVLFAVSACGNDQSLKGGFSYDNSPSAIMCAAQSDKSVFDKNDIALDFYYGHGQGNEVSGPSDENNEFISCAVYFCNAKYIKGLIGYSTLFEDYHNIEGYYFEKEISVEDFNSDSYDVSIKLFFGKKFNHHEELTVPKEVIELSKGDFCVVIMGIFYSRKDEAYFFSDRGYLVIEYEVIDEQNVRLSDPRGTIGYQQPQ